MTQAAPIVGILGGGQLGQMLGAAAQRLGIRVRFYQDDDTGPAAGAAEVFTGAWDDVAMLERFVEGCDVVTLDNEWVQLETIAPLLPAHVRLWPSVHTMELVSDKIVQREHARRSGLPVGKSMACASASELDAAANAFGFPLVVKRPRASYDGYGNRTAEDRDGLQQAYDTLAQDGSVLVEQWVPFEQELAVIVARRAAGETAVYPVATTVQREHRCEAVEVPARVGPETALAASEIARRAAEVYAIVGVVGIEMFALADGTVLLNEIAPRPHNTGHYTIDACVTSQFENHLRAVLDLPLGDTALHRPAAVMVNVLGRRHGASSLRSLAAALAVPGASVHIYGKREVRPGRKMGHVTAVAELVQDARAIAYEAAGRLEL